MKSAKITNSWSITEKNSENRRKIPYLPDSRERLMKYTGLCIGMTTEEKFINRILAIMEKLAKTEEW